jgi:son of sevenless
MEEIDGYLFREKDSKKNILYDIDEASMVDGSSLPRVKAATLVKLIEKVTNEDRIDNELLHIVFMTYPTFTTAEELLNLLVMRYAFLLLLF